MFTCVDVCVGQRGLRRSEVTRGIQMVSGLGLSPISGAILIQQFDKSGKQGQGVKKQATKHTQSEDGIAHLASGNSWTIRGGPLMLTNS